MHGVMGIVYGAMLASIVPTLRTWWYRPSEITLSTPIVGKGLRLMMAAMALGVFLSGIRDLLAAAELRGSGWPWRRH